MILIKMWSWDLKYSIEGKIKAKEEKKKKKEILQTSHFHGLYDTAWHQHKLQR